MTKRIFTALIAAAFAGLSALPALSEVSLMMFDRDGCPSCIEWKNTLGPIYPKTYEGRVAPLEITDIEGKVPENLTLKTRPFYSPTFILLDDGIEVGRIEGYPGEDWFWGLLGAMIKKLPDEKQKDPGIDPALTSSSTEESPTS
ncbi:MAG: hypothetical protein ACPGVK_06195 [Halocynthiibacter sp.]